MKWIVFFCLLLLTACSHRPVSLETEVLNGYTPVKSQGSSQSCWIYAMLAAIETEHIERGDSVNLSVAYVERMMEQEPEAPASGRGTCMTALRLIEKYGLVPYQTMPSADYPLPHHAYMLGCEYTMGEFGRSVCAPGEYLGLTSTPAAPYGEMVELPLADNWDHSQWLNVEPDTLLAVTERAVRQGHGVAWEGDITEGGFCWDEGYAVTSWWNGTTSDNHCMAIVGIAHDEQGERYFIMKNSWGTGNACGGLLYMSFDYFRQKTIAVVLPTECLLGSRLYPQP